MSWGSVVGWRSTGGTVPWHMELAQRSRAVDGLRSTEILLRRRGCFDKADQIRQVADAIEQYGTPFLACCVPDVDTTTCAPV